MWVAHRHTLLLLDGVQGLKALLLHQPQTTMLMQPN
jgi:hypothetical protein